MDDNDKNDIIKKVNTAGNNDSKIWVIITTTTIMEMIMRVGLMIDLSFDSNNEVWKNIKFMSDDLFLDKPKKNNMFQPNSNDILDSTEPTIKETIKNLFNSKKIVCLTEKY
jgi:hypothetical protein